MNLPIGTTYNGTHANVMRNIEKDVLASIGIFVVNQLDYDPDILQDIQDSVQAATEVVVQSILSGNLKIPGVVVETNK